MNSNDSDKVIYDRTKLKEFAARGGLLNMVFNMLPRGIMQDGEVERLCKRIYTRIHDGRDATNLHTIYSDLDALGKILSCDVSAFKSPQIISTDEYAVHPAALFGYLYSHPDVRAISWKAPNILSMRASVHGREQSCRISVFSRDVSVSTVILHTTVYKINADMPKWLLSLHQILDTVTKQQFSVGGGMNVSGNDVFLLLGAHIPGKSIDTQDVLFLVHKLITIGDGLEKIISDGKDIY